eukprot:CAMPEP_0113276736 /NCGR_PEP_ID=MMETSP0008_2-20120614/25651_1 /TAXON_ID=97485 /ORGANISM="Prymnesium parvum" /LENGTH=38 /DNA_ID=CAMNT_0000126555 /DNA_START=151 /DNA_END=264 /DNA_ORIENTATION=+ /assembly_acc=CAM_ASM_000153
MKSPGTLATSCAAFRAATSLLCCSRTARRRTIRPLVTA